MLVEWVAGSPWNQWPDDGGIGGRMGVEYSFDTFLIPDWETLYRSIICQPAIPWCATRHDLRP